MGRDSLYENRFGGASQGTDEYARLLLLSDDAQLASEIARRIPVISTTVVQPQRFLRPAAALLQRLHELNHTVAMVDGRSNLQMAQRLLRGLSAQLPATLRIALVWPWSEAQTTLLPICERVLYYPLRSTALIEILQSRSVPGELADREST